MLLDYKDVSIDPGKLLVVQLYSVGLTTAEISTLTGLNNEKIRNDMGALARVLGLRRRNNFDIIFCLVWLKVIEEPYKVENGNTNNQSIQGNRLRPRKPNGSVTIPGYEVKRAQIALYAHIARAVEFATDLSRVGKGSEESGKPYRGIHRRTRTSKQYSSDG